MIKFLFLTSLLSLSTSRVVRAEGYAEEEELPMMGPMVTVWNSFQDSVITGGAEVVFDVSTSAVMEGVEFFGFPTGGFYDIDVTNHPGSIVWTLKNNSAASDLLLPPDRFDRYYFTWSDRVIHRAMIPNMDELNAYATVEVLPPGYVVELTDAFQTGIPVPITLENGGLVFAIGPGSDLTELEQQASVSFRARGLRGGKKGMPKDKGMKMPKDKGMKMPKDKGMKMPKDKGMKMPKEGMEKMPKDKGMKMPKDKGMKMPKEGMEKMAKKGDYEG